MKKPTIALLSLAFLGGVPGLLGVAAAQTAVTRIAYDQCRAGGGSSDSCSIGMAVDGSDTLIANGVGPKWSPDGTRIAFTGTTDPSAPYSSWDSIPEILVLNLADGSITNLTDLGAGWGPVWSPDGARIAFLSYRDGSLELYVMEASGANPTRVTHNVGFTGAFVWSPDGGRFAFASNQDGVPELYVTDVDGSNVTRLTNNVGFTGSFVWSPDGSRIAFNCLAADGGADICAINGDGTNFVRLISDPANDWGAVFSPVDGRIAFATDRFGAGAEIAVMDADGAVTRLAAGTGGVQPAWSPDGNRLIFASTIPFIYTGTCYFGPLIGGDDFCIPVGGIYLVNADGTGLTAIASGDNPDWFTPLPGQPVAAFTSDCSASTCDFDAAGSFDPDGTIATYLWQFGDGTSSSGPTAHHVYATGDPHNVTLTVTDDSGASGIVRKPVPANIPPVASFTVACSGATCTFDASASSDPDGTIASYVWSFGDGVVIGAGATVTHGYPTGTFSVSLIVADNVGAVGGTAPRTLSVVNAPPVASFTVACNGPTCTFDGSGSSDPDGTIARYDWYFGDGQMLFGCCASWTHIYHTGTFSPTLIVTDNSGSTSTAVRTLSVVNAPPVATFTSTCNGLTCTFDGSGSSDPDGTITRYVWSFGDGGWAYSGGGAGLGAIRSHTFAAGTYTVTLYVTADVGEASQSHTVTVGVANASPVASFTSTCSGLTCSFNASGSSDPDGTIASYAWTFGDATTGSGATVSRTYAAGGTYTVTLTVTDNGNAASQTAHVVTANVPNAPPIASFTSACSGLTCSFNASGSSDPDGTIASYAWTFGDAATGSGATVSRTYAAGGTYTVTLTVTDNAAATSQTVNTVTVNAPPVASFTSACSALTCSFNASASSDPDGTIASYAWTFGDATNGSGATVSRTYATGGTYTVTLTVTDNAAATSQMSHVVTVNAPPVASFTSACSGLTCSFNASGSSDPDGTIASYAWTFGNGTTGSGATVSRTYAAGGTYSVLLTVTDNGSATGTRTQSVTVVAPDMHVGDLDRASTIQQNSWMATVTITVHTGSHGALANATVSGIWSGGSTVSCTTNANGRCAVSRAGIPKNTGSVTFSVTTVAMGSYVYKPANNHDPDGDSNGTTITVIK